MSQQSFFAPLICLLLAGIFINNDAMAQRSYWQQEVNFTIRVSLNDADHTLEAFETIQYINNSPDTLRYIWFHLWPNAYKNDRTAFSEQRLKEGLTDFYFSKPYERGYINQLQFKVNGSLAVVVNDTLHIDMVKVLLPRPLPPGKTADISTPFKVKLPYNFSRGGHVGKTYQVTQWFPKPAVYDHKGWHPMPYLDQGEFFSDFGKYDVQITVPAAYAVAATGILQDEATQQQLKQTGKHITSGRTKTWHFTQDNIHDFAWFADKDMVAHFDTVVLPSKKVVDVWAWYKPSAKGWDKALAYAKRGIRSYSAWLGDYPYNTATIVKGSKNENSGGMEYPTITLITTQSGGKELDATIVHEIGHNWFEAAIATDERTHPWMDEGMNSFYQKRYEADNYTRKVADNMSKTADNDGDLLLATLIKANRDQPIETPSALMSTENYGLVAYGKTAEWMKHLENTLGRAAFDKAMQQYYAQWRFRHPYPEDFKAVFEKQQGRAVAPVFSLLNKTGYLTPPVKRTIKPTLIFNLRNTDKYNYLSFGPAAGYNAYDKAMAGLSVHNYQLPMNNLQFGGAALYGTGSGKWNGVGTISYNSYKRQSLTSVGLNFLNYSIGRFTTDEGKKLNLRMQRWSPYVKATWYNKDPLSTKRVQMLYRLFLIKEDQLQFDNNTTAVTLQPNNRYVNRFAISVFDKRELYPYNIAFNIDQGATFARAGLTAKGYFNYADGKTGMDVRFFAGKFFYLTEKTTNARYDNDRYLLNLSGPKGYEDYTYSDYFVGRNDFEGWRSQQVMERDGFFKVNTELLSSKVGKTDDWLMAVNLSSSLPDKINPLSVLPISLPLKVFADIGTYAEAWKDNPASGRFVYDAGFQLSLFNSAVNVYVPVLYSSVYSNYYKSVITEKRFLRTIAFSINLQNLNPKGLIKEVEL